MSADPRTIWKRRLVLMAIVGLLVAIPVTVLTRSGDDTDPTEPEVQVPPLGKTDVNRDLGVKLQVPRGWRSETESEVIELRSKNKGTRVAISAPGPAADADKLYDETLAELRKSYKQFKVLAEIKREKLGGLRARAAAVEAVPPGGDAASRLLVSTAPGKEHAYLVVVATSGSDSGKSLVEAQALLNGLQLTD